MCTSSLGLDEGVQMSNSTPFRLFDADNVTSDFVSMGEHQGQEVHLITAGLKLGLDKGEQVRTGRE